MFIFCERPGTVRVSASQEFGFVSEDGKSESMLKKCRKLRKLSLLPSVDVVVMYCGQMALPTFSFSMFDGDRYLLSLLFAVV